MQILLTVINGIGMSDDLKGAIITALVTGIISIIGFVVTNVSMRKSFQNELLKQRDSISLEKMSTKPFEVLDFMDRMIKGKNWRDEETEKDSFNKMMNEIYSYGSEKAIALVALMQKENYDANRDESEIEIFRVMSLYVLLATQIKFDVTGKYVNPEFWFRMRLMDFEKNRCDIREANNKLVEELSLSEKLKIK